MSRPRANRNHCATGQAKSKACSQASPNPKPKCRSLAAFRFGVAKAESRLLNAIARALTLLGIPDTVETRLRRFISNPRIEMAESCENLARSVIRAPPRKKPVILIVDETRLQDRLKVMVVSVACEGRAAPAAMMTYHQMCQVEMIATTLRWVRDGTGKGRDLVAMADRGIGPSPNLLKAIEGLGMRCMMRVSMTVRALMDDETVSPFKRLTAEPGGSWRVKAKAFKNAGGAPSTSAVAMSRGIRLCADAESWGDGMPVAEDSSRGGRRECERGKRVQSRTDSVSELVMESPANPMRAEIADRIEGGEKV